MTTSYLREETIAQIATPPGDGGVAIVRISGKEAFQLAAKLFSKPIDPLPTHTLTFGRLLTKEGTVLDQILLAKMEGPKTFTGEDVIELHCHGGSFLVKKVLDRCLEVGAQAALPGEFTFRAYRNGKIDLTQAEAIQSLIGAKSEQALTAAKNHLEGTLSKRLQGIQQELIDITAILEASLDFPDEGLALFEEEQIEKRLAQALQQKHHLLATYHEGRLLEEGIKVALVGPPNAGKSSLLNTLLGYKRALVSPVAGTTRDYLQEQLHLGPYLLHLLDTAGIREGAEEIEAAGIVLSKELMEKADLVLCLFDAEKGLEEEQQKLLEALPDNKTLLVWNKVDLNTPPQALLDAHAISCVTGEGLETLKQKMLTFLDLKDCTKDEVWITKRRHQESLQKSYDLVQVVYDNLKKPHLSLELVIEELKQALYHFSHILGGDVQEDVLSSIFRQFCVGK